MNVSRRESAPFAADDRQDPLEVLFPTREGLVERRASAILDITQASKAALTAIRSRALGTLLAVSWPWADPEILELQSHRQINRVVNTDEPILRRAGYRSSAEFGGHDITEVYGAENPPTGLIEEMSAWADALAEGGLEILVLLRLQGTEGAIVDVFSDIPEARTYLDNLCELTPDGERYYKRQGKGERVVVGGNPAVLAKLFPGVVEEPVS